jgi:hypothetical protein
MRILSCVARSYYGDPVAVNPIYYYFVDALRSMGHDVCHFDHCDQARWNKDAMNDAFLSLVRGGRFACVLVEAGGDEFFEEVLDAAKAETTTVLFDSDDDFRWLEYSSAWASHFTHIVTTYRHVYEAAKGTHPNLLLSQWACTGTYDGLYTRKDIGLSFVGGVHAGRADRLAHLKRRLPLQIHGAGVGRAEATVPRLLGILRQRMRGGRGTRRALLGWMNARYGGETGGISYEEANGLWCRTRISITPLDLSSAQAEQKRRMAAAMGHCEDPVLENPWAYPFQIKGRVFEMGTTGTLMLCDRNPALDEYYDRGKEYDDFESLDECAEKAMFYLRHETACRRIASAYHDRTRKEHLWQHRFSSLFTAIGLQ